MINELPADERKWLIEEEAADEIEAARRHIEAEGPWEERGPIGVEHLKVLIDRLENPHSMTDYPCRLPDGRMGKVAIREVDGEWEAICVL
jgi:hypothetical protein